MKSKRYEIEELEKPIVDGNNTYPYKITHKETKQIEYISKKGLELILKVEKRKNNKVTKKK